MENTITKEQEIVNFIEGRKNKRNTAIPHNIKQYVVDDYVSGMKRKDVAERYNISPWSVTIIAKEFGYEVGENKRIIKSKQPKVLGNVYADTSKSDIDADTIAIEYLDGNSIKELAKTYRVTQKKIKSILKENSIEIKKEVVAENKPLEAYTEIEEETTTDEAAETDSSTEESINMIKPYELDQDDCIEAISDDEDRYQAVYSVEPREFNGSVLTRNHNVVSVNGIYLTRLIKPKTVTAVMIAGRHEFPIEKAIIPDEAMSVFDFNKYSNITRSFITNNFTFTNGEANEYLTLYATGLTQCMTAIIKECLNRQINLKILYYKSLEPGKYLYVPQYTITQFGSMSQTLQIMSLVDTNAEIFIDLTNFNINNFIRIRVNNEDGKTIACILTSTLEKAMELSQYLRANKSIDVVMHSVVNSASGVRYFKL